MNLKRTGLLVFSSIFILSGCHLVIGPDEDDSEWWYYCDSAGCYMCNYYGCELPGSSCSSRWDCPSDMYCDESTGSCMTDRVCRVSADCGEDSVCIRGLCTMQWGSCQDHESCGDGGFCSNGQCKDSELCSDNEDCAALGPNMICDERGTCIPGEAPIETCESGSTCADGLCLDGTCASCSGDCGGSTTCQFDNHCADDQSCLDGQCTSNCTIKEDCSKGQTCQGSVCVTDLEAACGADIACVGSDICVNNVCRSDCSATGICRSAKDVCSDVMDTGTQEVRVCLPDAAASYECKLNKDCTGGELCVNGVCRTACVEDADCAICEDGPVCSQSFCMTAAEANPQCTVNTDCTDGKVCLNAQCVTL